MAAGRARGSAWGCAGGASVPPPAASQGMGPAAKRVPSWLPPLPTHTLTLLLAKHAAPNPQSPSICVGAPPSHGLPPDLCPPRIFEGAPEYGDLKLNSMYFELGENSFMKEAVAAQVGGGASVVGGRVWAGAKVAGRPRTAS